MKVWAWIGAYRDPDEPSHQNQGRFVVAARSMAAAARSWQPDARPRQLFNLAETGNDVECITALAEPGVLFVRGLDSRLPFRRFHADAQDMFGRSITD